MLSAPLLIKVRKSIDSGNTSPLKDNLEALQTFNIKDIDFDKPIDPLEIIQNPNAKNYDDLIMFCRIKKVDKKMQTSSMIYKVKSFYKSCSFLKFYKQQLNNDIYGKFLDGLEVDLRSEGEIIFNTKDEDKDFFILLHGKIEPEEKTYGRQPRRSLSYHSPKNQIPVDTTNNKSFFNGNQSPRNSQILSNSSNKKTKRFSTCFSPASINMQNMMASGKGFTAALVAITQNEEPEVEPIIGPLILNTYISIKFVNVVKDYRLVCATDCVLLRMPWSNYKKIWSMELDKIKEQKMNELYRMPILRDLPENVMRDLFARVVEKKLNYRNKLYTFGDKVESIYFIRKGDFSVTIDYTILDNNLIDEVEKRMQNRINHFIKTGKKEIISQNERTKCKKIVTDYFGDFEVLMGQPERMSEVVCVSNNAEVYEISKNYIDEHLKRNLQTINEIKINDDMERTHNDKIVKDYMVKQGNLTFQEPKTAENNNDKRFVNLKDKTYTLIKVPKKNNNHIIKKSKKQKNPEFNQLNSLIMDPKIASIINSDVKKPEKGKDIPPSLNEEYYKSLLTTNLQEYNSVKKGIDYIDEDQADLAKNPSLKWTKDRDNKMIGSMQINFDTFLKDGNTKTENVEFDVNKVDLKHVIESTRQCKQPLNE